jgi:preprotein translocase subunit SecB
MDKPTKSILSFDNYIVKNISFEANSNFKPSEKIPLEVEFFHDLDVDLSGNMAAVGLGCSIFKESKENHPFCLEIELVGFFKFETTLEPEQIEKLLRINATAILFPYLRSIVSSITANSGFQTLVLPIVNIHKVLEQQEREEKNDRE